MQLSDEQSDVKIWAGSEIKTDLLPVSIHGFNPESSTWSPYETGRRAAVAMLFVPPADGDDQARIVLTRRSTRVSSHKGQIGFAGGRAESDDAGPAATALREVEEEIGLSPDQVKVHGTLPSILALDGSPVVPVVATANVDVSEFTLAQTEVDSLILEPWKRLHFDHAQCFEFNLLGTWRKSYLFDLPENPVWGLTALIIYNAKLM